MMEEAGFALTNRMSHAVRTGADASTKAIVAGTVQPPGGPGFDYQLGPELFLGRTGRGALHVAWDTNLLLDYFEYGESLWNMTFDVESVPGGHGAEIEALQVLLSLWVIRDIRLHVMRATLTDSKRGPLGTERRAARLHAWREFVAAIEHTPSPADPEPHLMLPPRFVESLIAMAPEGGDQALLREALALHAHVFLTRDADVLRCREAFAQAGLLIVSPLDLLEVLAASGALHCLFEPRFMYWAAPDQGKVQHLIRALSHH